MTLIASQICEKCKVEKHPKAFLGDRLVCRVCWIYLTEDEKELHHATPKRVRDKNAAYQRERLARLSLTSDQSSLR